MLLQFLNGELVEIDPNEINSDDILDKTKIKQYLVKHHPEMLPDNHYLTLTKKDDETILILFAPCIKIAPFDYKKDNFAFLSDCTNESILRIFLPYIRDLWKMWSNPHPLVVKEILPLLPCLSTVINSNPIGYLEQLAINPSDEIVQFIKSNIQNIKNIKNIRIDIVDFCENKNPIAQDYIREHFVSLTRPSLFSFFGSFNNDEFALRNLFTHPYEPSIHFVWNHLFLQKRYDELAKLPPNDHLAAVKYRLDNLELLRPYGILESSGVLQSTNAELLQKGIEHVIKNDKVYLLCNNPSHPLAGQCLVEHIDEIGYNSDCLWDNPCEPVVDYLLTLPFDMYLLENKNPRAIKRSIEEIEKMSEQQIEEILLDTSIVPEILLWTLDKYPHLAITHPFTVLTVLSQSEIEVVEDLRMNKI